MICSKLFAIPSMLKWSWRNMRRRIKQWLRTLFWVPKTLVLSLLARSCREWLRRRKTWSFWTRKLIPNQRFWGRENGAGLQRLRESEFDGYITWRATLRSIRWWGCWSTPMRSTTSSRQCATFAAQLVTALIQRRGRRLWSRQTTTCSTEASVWTSSRSRMLWMWATRSCTLCAWEPAFMWQKFLDLHKEFRVPRSALKFCCAVGLVGLGCPATSWWIEELITEEFWWQRWNEEAVSSST